MDIKDILSVGLTAGDFDLIIKGLDAIPEYDSWKMIATETIGLMLAPNESRADERIKSMNKRLDELKRKEEARKEEFILLKSKLILLKRHLLSNDVVREARDIIGGEKL